MAVIAITPEKTLEVAAKYLREHGWTRATMGGNGGPACALGAIREASKELVPATSGRMSHVLRADTKRDHLAWAAQKLLIERIRACFPRSNGARNRSVIDFNDARTRKIGDVLKVLEGGCE